MTDVGPLAAMSFPDGQLSRVAQNEGNFNASQVMYTVRLGCHDRKSFIFPFGIILATAD